MSVNATVNVTLSAAATNTVDVQYSTADGTAKSGTDYTATSGTLIFPVGTTTQTITVPVTSPVKTAPDDLYFYINLSGLTGDATLGTSQCVCTIVSSS